MVLQVSSHPSREGLSIAMVPLEEACTDNNIKPCDTTINIPNGPGHRYPDNQKQAILDMNGSPAQSPNQGKVKPHIPMRTVSLPVQSDIPFGQVSTFKPRETKASKLSPAPRLVNKVSTIRDKV